MNFNKCSRCGCFFLSDGIVCPNCAPKDEMEMSRLQNYMEENSGIEYSMNQVISSTGISDKNLNRFLSQKQFSTLANQIQKDGFTNC